LQISLGELHVADLGVGIREITLPDRIARVGFGEAVFDREAGGKAFHRRFQITLRDLHVADIVVGDRDTALPTRVARIGFGYAASGGEAVRKGFQRGGEVALGDLYSADLVASSCQAPLIVHIVRFLCRQVGQQAVGLCRPRKLLLDVAQSCVIARELNQHQGLLIAHLGCRAAVACHDLEQSLSLCEKGECRGPGDIELLGLGYRLVDNLRRLLQGRREEGLVGFELLPRIDRAPARRDCEQEEQARERRPKAVLPFAGTFSPTNHIIRAEAGQACDHLGEPETLAVVAVAQVWPEDRDGISGDRAVRRDLVAQGGRKVLGPRPLDNDGNHRPVRMAGPEQPHLLVDGGPAGRNRRAEHDEGSGGVEGRDRGLGQAVPARKILTVAKDRPQCLRDRSEGGLRSDQVLVEAIGLERAMQPFRPLFIGVAVAQERAIFPFRDFIHGRRLHE